MEDKYIFSQEEKAALDEIERRGGMEALSLEELDSIAGGASNHHVEGGKIHADMREYSPVFFSLAVNMAILYKSQGHGREETIAMVHDYYYNRYNIEMEHLEACITQERWNSL